jgi:hypothetical protein
MMSDKRASGNNSDTPVAKRRGKQAISQTGGNARNRRSQEKAEDERPIPSDREFHLDKAPDD